MGLRGDDEQTGHMFSYLSPEQRVPADHPLRAIRSLTDAALRTMSRRFARLYAKTGPPVDSARAVAARTAGLLSDEHFTVDGTQLEAWASLKSFQRRNATPGAPAPLLAVEVDGGIPRVVGRGTALQSPVSVVRRVEHGRPRSGIRRRLPRIATACWRHQQSFAADRVQHLQQQCRGIRCASRTGRCTQPLPHVQRRHSWAGRAATCQYGS